MYACVCVDPERRNQYLYGHGYDDKTRCIILINGAVTFRWYAMTIGDGLHTERTIIITRTRGCRQVPESVRRSHGMYTIFFLESPGYFKFFFFFACKHDVIWSIGNNSSYANNASSRNIICTHTRAHAHTYVYTHT